MNERIKVDLAACLPVFRVCWGIVETYKLDKFLETLEICGMEHAQRTAYLALGIGMRLRLSEEQLRFLGVAALIHDIGKIVIPESTLCSPPPLTRQEKAAIMAHPATGAAMIGAVPFLSPAVPGILYHHCWYSNRQKDPFKGYPRGISGSGIPLEARIIAVADAFDAMTSERPYRAALPLGEAMGQMVAGAGEQFDPVIVETFMPAAEARPAEAADGNEVRG